MTITANYSKLTKEAQVSTLEVLISLGQINIEASLKENISDSLKTYTHEIKEQWAKTNPKLAYPISVSEILEHPKSLSISDNDICASCVHLSYNPGELSICHKVFLKGVWPCSFDLDSNAFTCQHHSEMPLGESNFVANIEEVSR